MTKPRKTKLENISLYPGTFDEGDLIICTKDFDMFTKGVKYECVYSKHGTKSKTHDWVVIKNSGKLVNAESIYKNFELVKQKDMSFKIGDIIENKEANWNDLIKGDMGEVLGMEYVKDRDDWLLKVRWLKNDKVADFYAPYAKLVERKEVKPVVKKSTTGDWGF